MREAATYCGFSVDHFRSLVKAGKVRSARPTGRYRFRTEWLDEFMLGVPAATPKPKPKKKARPALEVCSARVQFDMSKL